MLKTKSMSMHLVASRFARPFSRLAPSVRLSWVVGPSQAVAFWQAAGCPAAFVPRRSFRRLAVVRFVRLLPRVLFFAALAFGPLLLAWLLRS